MTKKTRKDVKNPNQLSEDALKDVSGGASGYRWDINSLTPMGSVGEDVIKDGYTAATSFGGRGRDVIK